MAQHGKADLLRSTNFENSQKKQERDEGRRQSNDLWNASRLHFLRDIVEVISAPNLTHSKTYDGLPMNKSLFFFLDKPSTNLSSREGWLAWAGPETATNLRLAGKPMTAPTALNLFLQKKSLTSPEFQIAC